MWTVLGLMSITGWMLFWHCGTETDTKMCYVNQKQLHSSYVVTQNMFISYICSKSEIRLDDHGVRAAEAKLLLEETLLSWSGTFDREFCTGVTRKNTGQNEDISHSTTECDMFTNICLTFPVEHHHKLTCCS